MEDVTTVEFVRSVPPYLAGETAGFPPAIARHYTDRGEAKEIDAKVPVVSPASAAAKRALLAADANAQADTNSRRPTAAQRAT